MCRKCRSSLFRCQSILQCLDIRLFQDVSALCAKLDHLFHFKPKSVAFQYSCPRAKRLLCVPAVRKCPVNSISRHLSRRLRCLCFCHWYIRRDLRVHRRSQMQTNHNHFCYHICIKHHKWVSDWDLFRQCLSKWLRPTRSSPTQCRDHLFLQHIYLIINSSMPFRLPHQCLPRK